MKKKVAIQGIAGSYHDIAARNYHEGEEIESSLAIRFGMLSRRSRKTRPY